MSKQQKNEEYEISEADKKRLQKATALLAGYTNFMRWAGNFRRDEIQRHPRHASVVMLSPLQSGRFAFAVEGSTLLLGAQHFEMAWLGIMPFEAAYVSDRLYLSTAGLECLGVSLPSLTIGLFFDQKAKRSQMADCSYVVPVEIGLSEGNVTDVGAPQGLGIPINEGDIVAALNEVAKKAMDRRDLARLF